jgi:formate C-acetyltransferase
MTRLKSARRSISMANFDYPISERIKALKAKRARINKDLRLNFERNRILTDYFKSHMKQYPVLKKAGFLYQWCTTREINIDDDDIFLGDSGPQCRTVHFDIEQTSQAWLRGCFGDTDERFRAAWQVPGSVWVSERTASGRWKRLISGKTMTFPPRSRG